MPASATGCGRARASGSARSAAAAPAAPGARRKPRCRGGTAFSPIGAAESAALVAYWRSSAVSARPLLSSPSMARTSNVSIAAFSLSRSRPTYRLLPLPNGYNGPRARFGCTTDLPPACYRIDQSSSSISAKPTINAAVAAPSERLRWVSGMISELTTQIIAPAAKPSPHGSKAAALATATMPAKPANRLDQARQQSDEEGLRSGDNRPKPGHRDGNAFGHVLHADAKRGCPAGTRIRPAERNADGQSFGHVVDGDRDHEQPDAGIAANAPPTRFRGERNARAAPIC